MQFSSILITLLLSFNCFALSELKTKQALENLIFISKDGKVTYFQKNSGELQYSFNYRVNTVFQGSKYNRYKLDVAEDLNHIVFEVLSGYHSQKSYLKANDIYLSKFLSTDDPKLIGKGVSPKFHLNGKFLSYFIPQLNEVTIYDVKQDKVISKFKLSNQIQPYMVPKVTMITPDTIVFKDLNSSGYAAIRTYNLIEKSFATLYKSTLPGMSLNYCIENGFAYLLETPHTTVKGNTQILSIGLFNNIGFKNSEKIYFSRLADLNSLLCDGNQLYFIKTTDYNSKLNMKHSEVATLNLKTKKVDILTEKKYYTQIFKFGGMILTTLNGMTYIVRNNEKLTSDSIAKPETKI